MGKPINKTCCGGDYTVNADPVNPNAHQGSPVERHNADKEVERIRLANYIAVYVQNHIAGVRSFSDLAYAAIEEFYQD